MIPFHSQHDIVSEPPTDAVQLFTRRRDSYDRFIRCVLYQQGLESYFRRSPFLRSGQRVLDAGCGTGAVTLALYGALLDRGLTRGLMQAFDLTPAMLERFQERVRAKALTGIEVKQADVLRLGSLPPSWNNYDLIVSASMLEYVPRGRFVDALSGLRGLLGSAGRFVLFITKRSRLMQPLIGRWWKSNLYSADELEEAFRQAGFPKVTFGKFPPIYRHLTAWGHIVEATGRLGCGGG